MMKNRSYKSKNVIWESKVKQVAVIIICLTFTAIAIALYDYSSLKFWCTVILFGLGGTYVLIRFLNPKNLFVKPASELGKKLSDQWFLEDKTNPGSFLYSETGFIETIGNIQIDWNEVQSVFTHKRDLWVVDEICLDVFSKNEAIHLTESTLGWYQFIERMQVNLKINPDWMVNVTHPAFEENFTLIFDKANRSQNDAIREFYGHTAGNSKQK